MEIKDARGLLCPEPVLIAKSEMEKMGQGTFQVIVNTGAARDNINRLAKSKKWEVTVEPRGDEFVLTLKK